MKPIFILFVLIFSCCCSFAQKLDSIYFHLYTDSLKKGFYNYINVDGLYSDGHWLPLTEKDITLSSAVGYFRGNDLFIDSSYTGATVTVKAVVKSNPALWKEVIIYIRKRPFAGPLKTKDEMLRGMQSRKRSQQ